jgi:hypothetical protein
MAITGGTIWFIDLLQELLLLQVLSQVGTVSLGMCSVFTVLGHHILSLVSV